MTTDADLFRLFAGLALLLASAHVVARLFSRFRQPAVIGEIVGGLLLGPSLFGLAAPSLAGWLFPKTGPVASGLALVYQLGLLLLMFLTGTQMRSAVDKESVRTVTTISIVGMVVPFALGLLFASTTDSALIIGVDRNQVALTLVTAAAIAITSIPVISRIMLDLGILGTPFARVVLSVAVLEDIVLNIVIAMALGLVDRGRQGGFGLVSLLGIDTPRSSIVYHALGPVVLISLVGLAAMWLRRRHPMPAEGEGTEGSGEVSTSAMVTRSVLFILAISAVCIFLGIVPIFGAFVAGLMSARNGAGGERRHIQVIRGFSTGFFIPIYFAIIGLKLDLVHNLDFLFTAYFIVFACLAKAASVYLGARLSGSSATASVNFAVALNARGGPGIVLAGIAFDAGIVSSRFFTTLVLTAVVTSLMAGSWLDAAVSRKLAIFHVSDKEVSKRW